MSGGTCSKSSLLDGEWAAAMLKISGKRIANWSAPSPPIDRPPEAPFRAVYVVAGVAVGEHDQDRLDLASADQPIGGIGDADLEPLGVVSGDAVQQVEGRVGPARALVAWRQIDKVAHVLAERRAVKDLLLDDAPALADVGRGDRRWEGRHNLGYRRRRGREQRSLGCAGRSRCS